ncbi:MAG: hypothetical protein IIY70_05465, partial [Oscillospiraceae bacterium]|nr:hypothetical protein [Oscillospiraceae bacterium]
MEQQIDKTLGLLSIARKGGKLQLGEESVGVLLAEKRARLTVLASDAGVATVRRVRQQAEGTRQRVLVLPTTKRASVRRWDARPWQSPRLQTSVL